MFSKRALEIVGTFDARLFLFFEEIDWVERAAEAGLGFAILPDARFVHFGSVSVRQAPHATAHFLQRNRLLILRRYGARHGQPVSVGRELRRVSRVVVGHLFRGRFITGIASARGWIAGWVAPLEPDTEALASLAEQRWESRGAMGSRV